MEADAMAPPPLMDVAVLDALLQYGPPSFLAKLVDVYLETTGIHVGNAEKSAQTDEWETLVFSAHSLKSSAGNLGLPRMLDTVRKLELAARSKNRQEVDTQVGGLRQTWVDSCAALVEYRAKL